MYKRISVSVEYLQPHGRFQAEISRQFPIKTIHCTDFYPVASDCKFEPVLQTLDTAKPVTLPPGQTRMAVLVGESFLPSALSAYTRHADALILADINPEMLAYIKFEMQTLLASPTREAYLATLSSDKNPYIQLFPSPFRGKQSDSEYRKSRVKQYADIVMNKLPSRSFLYSEARYQQCRTAAQGTPLYYANVNLFDASESRQLSDLIRQNSARITVLNATNLYDYRADEWLQSQSKEAVMQAADTRCSALLASLPLSENPVIVYSKFVKYGKNNGNLNGCGSFIARSAAEYLRDNQASALGW